MALGVLKAFAPGDIPRLAEVGIDAPAALFTAAILILVTVIVGFVPGLVASRMRSVDGLLSATRVSEGRVTARLRDGLIAEIALASALVICAGLSLRSLHALTRVDIGFATEQRFSFKTNLTADAYPTPEKVDAFYDQLTNTLAALPGTRSVGFVSVRAVEWRRAGGGSVTGPGSVRRDSSTTVGWGIVRGRYFKTMGVGLMAGRLFEPGDRADSLPVLIDRVSCGDAVASDATLLTCPPYVARPSIPPATSQISPSRVPVRSVDLAIGKALAEECVLTLEERTTPNRREQLGERIQREIHPGGSLETPCVRRTDATGNRGDVFIDETIGLCSGSREPFQFELAQLSAP